MIKDRLVSIHAFTCFGKAEPFNRNFLENASAAPETFPRTVGEVPSVQRHRPAVQTAIFNGHHTVEGTGIVPDAAGVQKQGPAPHVHQRAVGVAEEEQIQRLLFRRVAGVEQGLLDTVGMTVAEEDPLFPQDQQLLRRLPGTAITVARHLLQRDVRELFMEPLSIPPAVSQMEDQVGIRAFHCQFHIGEIPVGI